MVTSENASGDHWDDATADQWPQDGNAEDDDGGRCVSLGGDESTERGWDATSTESDDEGAGRSTRTLEIHMTARGKTPL